MEENKLNLSFYGRSAIDRPSLVEDDARSGYVKCGDDNLYYDYIYNTYSKSPLLQSAIEAIHKYVANFNVESEQEDIEDVIEKCAFDYILFGGFCLFVVRKFGKTFLSWVDFKNVRTNKDCTHFWYSKKWEGMRANFIEFPKYDKNSDVEKSIFYFNGNTRRGERVYPIPSYSGALLDVETDAAISEFWNSSINNGFNASAFVTFCNGVPSTDIQEEIEKKINNKFSGSGNAGKMLLSFVDSKDKSVDIQRIAEDNFDQKYQALTETIQKRIFAALHMNPMLCGVNVNTGFAKQEFLDAYNVAYITVIAPIQKVLARQFDKVGLNVEFTKLSFNEDGETTVENTDDILNSAE